MKTIDPREFQTAAERPLLIDVRTPAEFEEIHIEGSLLHPLTQLKVEQVRTAAEDRAVCLVCRTGNRARQAAEKLEAAGMKDVLVLEGGVEAWTQAELPVKRGRKTISLERQVRIGAGGLALVGALLGYFVHPAWNVIPAFVGAGLLVTGVTDWCAMAILLARMPWNNVGGAGRGDQPARSAK
jgi:rhodanese-related sulfurtransferase